jgi:hypothetical protein
MSPLRQELWSIDSCGNANLMSGIYLGYRRMNAAGSGGSLFDHLSRYCGAGLRDPASAQSEFWPAWNGFSQK